MNDALSKKGGSSLFPARILTLMALLLALALAQGCAVKPDPITLDEHQKRVADDKKRLYEGQEPITGPLTLEMALARALKYNYDNRLAIMETVFHDQQLTAATYAMLPRFAASAGYTHRDNELASSSVSYKTRQQTLEPSVSSEKDSRTAGLNLSWSLLDFGLSYFQAKQQGDRLLIMQERKRRVMNNIVKEVVDAYWKAATAQKLLPLLDRALQDAHAALEAYEAIQKERLGPPLETLEQHRDLLAIVSLLRRLQADMTMSRIKLAALINAPLTASFEVALPDKARLTPPVLKASLEELEDKGLALRPDLREEAYQERVDKMEVYKEIVRMLPGATLFGGYNYDSNKYLVNTNWADVGAQATMNLFSLITGPMQIKAAQTRVEVSRTHRLAQTVAALVQINLSYYLYKQALEDYEYTRRINSVEEKIYGIARAEHAAAAQSRLALIRRFVSSVRSQIEHDRAFSDLYQYWGNMYFSLGGDIIPQSFEDESLEAMAASIGERMDAWWGGRLPYEPDRTPGQAPAQAPLRGALELTPEERAGHARSAQTPPGGFPERRGRNRAQSPS